MNYTEDDLRDALRELERLSPSIPTDVGRYSSRRSRGWVLPLASAAAACVLAVGLAVVTQRSNGSSTSGVGPADQAASSVPASKIPSAPPGYIRAATHTGAVGFLRSSDLNGTQMTPTNPTDAIRTQTNRGKWGLLAPIYSADLHTVIGAFAVGTGATETTCPRQDGISFTVSPPSSAPGADSPITAAREVQNFYGIAGFGTRTSPWTVSAASDSAATVTADNTTLQVEHRTDGTWLVHTGQHCNP
ncbi:MAG: hypothetical protein DLM61_10830 [Pseudonocardiales bacterium]|nr:MAG: hypothetical protein DLM61_10830 [Pseudonocardiales bacterium]